MPRASRLRLQSLVALGSATLFAQCTLASLSGLSGGPRPDGGSVDVEAAAPPRDEDAVSADVGAAQEQDAGAVFEGGAALVQAVSMTYATTASIAKALGSPVAAGDLLLGVMLTHSSDADAGFGISDNLGNSWKATAYRRCSSAVGLRIWYVEASRPGVEEITATQSVTGGELGLAVFEYRGIAESDVLDVEASACAATATAMMASPGVTTNAEDVIVGAFVDPCGQGTMTPGPGFGEVDVLPAYYYLFEALGDGGAAPPGFFQATATNPRSSNCWLGAIAAFKLR